MSLHFKNFIITYLPQLIERAIAHLAHPAKPALDIGKKIHLFCSLLVSLYVVINSILPFMKNVGVSLLSRVHNKRREEEYLTFITNALYKVCAVNHWVLLFCINTFRVTKIKDLITCCELCTIQCQIFVVQNIC